MAGYFHDLLFMEEFAFLRQAFLLSALASLPFGVVGTFVVVRRIGYLASAISHSAFGGIGLGIFLRQWMLTSGLTAMAFYLNPLAVAMIFSILSAILIALVRHYAQEREDAIIGSIWATGMAIGILFLDKTSGYHSVSAYLFGEILLTSHTGVFTVGVLGIGVLVVMGFFFKRFEATCFDEEFVTLRGLPSRFYFQLLLILVAVTVVLMIQLVGVILVIALLTLPAATAARLTHRLFSMALLATVLCFIFSWSGLFFSTLFDLAAAPTIILVAAFGYTLVLGMQYLASRFSSRQIS